MLMKFRLSVYLLYVIIGRIIAGRSNGNMILHQGQDYSCK